MPLIHINTFAFVLVHNIYVTISTKKKISKQNSLSVAIQSFIDKLSLCFAGHLISNKELSWHNQVTRPSGDTPKK